MYAVQQFKIKSIVHKYLIAGHTQNEGDATHSTIEREVRIKSYVSNIATYFTLFH